MYQQTEEKIWVPYNPGQDRYPLIVKIKRDIDQPEVHPHAGVEIIDGLYNLEGSLAGIIDDPRSCSRLVIFYNEDGMPVKDQPSIKYHEEEFQLMMQVPCCKGYTIIALGSSPGSKTTTIELTVPFETREEAEEWISREGDPFIHVVAEVKWPAIR